MGIGQGREETQPDIARVAERLEEGERVRGVRGVRGGGGGGGEGDRMKTSRGADQGEHGSQQERCACESSLSH